MNTDGEYCDLNGFETDYEISKAYPYRIRNKRTKRILYESKSKTGYYTVHLNGKTYNKHTIIAKQFIDNKNNYPCIDHINHNRTDNRIENMRWTTYKNNNINRKSFRGKDYKYIDYSDINNSDMIIIDQYNDNEFEDYYYNISTNAFYYDTGVNYKELHINNDKNNQSFVNMINTNDKSIRLYVNKFKRLYDIDN